ncbi:TetR family transcriptional regulator [Desulfobacterales bacterium HSG16]|nr:TetR family transcriptional regulator [Desulfobacterales bacterium HSG16]
MASRAELKEQKEKTSMALIHAAIQLCAEEGYASLSLRSVARKAGIAPTSFYRHFRDIDELGVAIVDQAKTVLKKCLSHTRKKMLVSDVAKNSSPEQILQSIESVVRPFVETFMEFFEQNSHLLCLFFQERTGSSEPMRIAILEGMNSMVEFLSEDLRRIGQKFPDGFGEIRLIAESMITIVSHNAVVMLIGQNESLTIIIEQSIKKLNLLLLGASIYGQDNTRAGNTRK